MMASFLRTRMLSAAGALDRRLHTSPRGPTDTFSGPERAKPARNSFHCCKLLSAVRLRVVLTVLDHTHVQLLQNTTHIHAHRTYRHDQGSLLNTYFFLGLRRPRSRNSADRPSSLASVTTRSGAGSDLPGGRRTMTGSDDDAPAARGPPLGARARLQHTTFCMRALRTCITQ